MTGVSLQAGLLYRYLCDSVAGPGSSIACAPEHVKMIAGGCIHHSLRVADATAMGPSKVAEVSRLIALVPQMRGPLNALFYTAAWRRAREP